MTLKERAEHRRQVLSDYHGSELTQAAFCSARGVALSTLQYWLKREREEVADDRPNGFVEVPKANTEAVPSTSPIRVRIGGRVIVEIDPPLTAGQLCEILKAAGAL